MRRPTLLLNTEKKIVVQGSGDLCEYPLALLIIDLCFFTERDCHDIPPSLGNSIPLGITATILIECI